MPARECGHQIGGNLRGVRKRLIVKKWQLGNYVLRFPRRDVQLGVIRPEMRGHLLGLDSLVVLGLRESNREGPCRSAPMFLHECNNKGGINPTREEGPHRNIGDHAQSHRVCEQIVELPEDFLLASLKWIWGAI